MLDSVKVLIGDSAKEEILAQASRLTPKQRDILVRWLESLSAEKLLDDGVALGGNLRGVHQVENHKYTLRFIIHNDDPVVIQLIIR